MATVWYTGYDGVEYPMDVPDRQEDAPSSVALMTRADREAGLAAMSMADLRSLLMALYLEPHRVPGRAKQVLIGHILTEEEGATWE
jgi:hypothetical protein